MEPKIKSVHTTCPGCRSEFVTAINVADVVTAELEEAREKLAQAQRAAAESSKPKGPDMPSFLPRYKCKTCNNSFHPNPNFKGLPKGQCDTCYQMNPVRGEGPCPFCEDGQLDVVDVDDLKMMGVLPEDYGEEKPHSHEH